MTRKNEMLTTGAEETVEIELVDDIPKMVIAPPEIPERDLSDFEL